MTAAPDPVPGTPANDAASSSPSPACPRPASPTAALYRERLLPSPGAWIVVVALGSIVGLVIVPLNSTLALIVAIVSIAIAIVLAVQYSPVVAVRDGTFFVGRAQIDVGQLGEPAVLEGEEWKLLIGQDFEPLAYHCVRGWVHAGIRVDVLDEEDPTSAWVVSSRRPQDLVLALRTAQQQA